MKKFKIINKDNGESETLTIPEIIENINRDRSEDWTDYDESDWIEGLLEVTEYYLELEAGQKMNWNDPDEGLCSGPVIVIQTVVLENNSGVVVTDKGEMPIHELSI